MSLNDVLEIEYQVGIKFKSSPDYDNWDFNKLIWMYDRVMKQQEDQMDSDRLDSIVQGL